MTRWRGGRRPHRSVTYQRRLDEGTCVWCGLVAPEEDRVACRPCADERNERKKRPEAEPGFLAMDARLEACVRCPVCELLVEPGEEHVCIGTAADYARSGEEGGSDGGGSFRSIWGGRSR